MSAGARHLYVHLPFCAHRCGYCDFVTVVGRRPQHSAYVDALLAELELERTLLAPELETVFLGGGTPTFTEPRAFERLLAALPQAAEVTVEANPETVTQELARMLRRLGVNRVSLGVQSFQPHLLEVLERVAKPDTVRRAFYHLRDAGFDNISFDLIYGIPGQSTSDLGADLGDALELAPEHVSCYELEAKPGTRFTHAHGAELERQAEAMESYFELVVERLTSAGYRWYETANFCREPERADGRDLRSRHNLAYWLGRDYLGIGVGAVSTIEGRRWRNTPRLPAYLHSLGDGARPEREVEPLSGDVIRRERLMLGLRLDEPLGLAEVADVVDSSALGRLQQLGLVRSGLDGAGSPTLALTPRGRLLGGGVTADCLPEPYNRSVKFLQMASDQRNALSARQRDLLARLIEEYVATGQPVGSRYLVERAGLSVSSSTVRNELAELEARGLLTHPHTSAGRIPTEQGYRFYADELLAQQGPKPEGFPLDLSELRREIDSALEATSEMLSRVTHLLALASAPPLETTTVRHVEVLLLNPRTAMAVVITSTGGVAKRVVTFGEAVDPGLAKWAGEYLNERVAGLRLGTSRLRRELDEPSLSAAERGFLNALKPAFTDLLQAEQRLFVGGTAGLLDDAREDELGIYRHVLVALERRVGLLGILGEAFDSRRAFVRVGGELEHPAFQDAALVGATYGLSHRALGAVGLLGPVRMDYDKAIRSVRGAAQELSRFVEEVYEDN